MQIFSLGDNLHEVSILFSRKKKKKNMLKHRLLKFLSSMQSAKYLIILYY